MLSLEQGPMPCHVGFFHPFLGTCHHVDKGKIPKRTGNLLLGFQQLAFQLPILLNFSSWCLQERRFFSACRQNSLYTSGRNCVEAKGFVRVPLYKVPCVRFSLRNFLN